ncbi:hypothetical protein H6G97_29850 [Nostoc flagelliforme FACHB-838]|uniref:Uncharacterized protein n=1 Tax=Nostoc flagelliforme FACHB-838 TaxID=2692904 RepID=A0ABR8DVR6_9NOSO|nr:hypothetical protein [Nostoc flagelliforme]MBD2533536.1 hypothetical protein [Nostoc flagelliforme FACHB-838]
MRYIYLKDDIGFSISLFVNIVDMYWNSSVYSNLPILSSSKKYSFLEDIWKIEIFSLIPRSKLKKGENNSKFPFLKGAILLHGFPNLYPYSEASYAYPLPTGEGTGVDLGEYLNICYQAFSKHPVKRWLLIAIHFLFLILGKSILG